MLSLHSVLSVLDVFPFTLQFTSMRKYFVKTPRLLKAAYSSCIWHVKAHSNSVYLTFDDGPHPEVTPFVLDQLHQYNARGTFFCIGKNVQDNTSIYNNVLAGGHSVGNHTFDHFNGFKVANADYLSNVELAQQCIKSDLFRPPYGRITPAQIKLIRQQYPSMKIVMWDILSGDFDTNLSPEDCLKNTLRKIQPGSIVVFHDSAKAEKRLRYVLPRVLQHCQGKGWQMKGL
jgi:peptidoglycan-N-acetylglucosamine deacetylase